MPAQGGGTGVLVRDGLAFEKVKFNNETSNTLESCAIRLKLSNEKYLTIVSVYTPHNNKKTFINELNSLFIQNDMTAINNYFIIAGDLNARCKEWGDTTTNTRGAEIGNWISENAIDYRLMLYPPS